MTERRIADLPFPGFRVRLAAPGFMRLSLMKAAPAVASRAADRKFRVAQSTGFHQRWVDISSIIENVIARRSAQFFRPGVTPFEKIDTNLTSFCVKMQQGACSAASVKSGFLYYLAVKKRLGQLMI
jgi:hypothetical protein